MTIEFKTVALDEIRSAITAHLMGMPSPIDSFLEGHIAASVHHRILIAGKEAGFTSIHDSSLVTQFVLTDSFKHLGQAVFARVKRLESVTSAFVSTGDEFFLVHALDHYRQLALQAYFFVSQSARSAVSPRYQLQLARAGDSDFIHRETEDFLETLRPTLNISDYLRHCLTERVLDLDYKNAVRLRGRLRALGCSPSNDFGGMASARRPSLYCKTSANAKTCGRWRDVGTTTTLLSPRSSAAVCTLKRGC